MVSVFQEPLPCNLKSIEGHSIFQNHLLQKQNFLAVTHNNNELIWPSLLLIFSLVLLTIIKTRAYSRVVRIIQSTFSKQALQLVEREEFGSLKFSSLLLSFFFFLNLAFLIYKVNIIYHLVLGNWPAIAQFLFFLTVILFIAAFKTVVNFLLSLITGQRKILSEYNTNSLLINQTFGLFIFPCVALSEFSRFNPLIFICCAIIVLLAATLIKWYRGIITGLVEERIGLLQIFSYFCGLEILPVLVLVKFIIETF